MHKRNHIKTNLGNGLLCYGLGLVRSKSITAKTKKALQRDGYGVYGTILLGAQRVTDKIFTLNLNVKAK